MAHLSRIQVVYTLTYVWCQTDDASSAKDGDTVDLSTNRRELREHAVSMADNLDVALSG